MTPEAAATFLARHCPVPVSEESILTYRGTAFLACMSVARRLTEAQVAEFDEAAGVLQRHHEEKAAVKTRLDTRGLTGYTYVG